MAQGCFPIFIQCVSFIAVPSTAADTIRLPADASLLYDKAALLGAAIKETPNTIHFARSITKACVNTSLVRPLWTHQPGTFHMCSGDGVHIYFLNECPRAGVTTRGPWNCVMKPADTSLNYVLGKERTARVQRVEEIVEGLGWAHAMTYWQGNVTCNRHTFNQREQACVLSEPSNWDAPCTQNGGRSPTVELHTKWVTVIYC